jgi:hypothetical protein
VDGTAQTPHRLTDRHLAILPEHGVPFPGERKPDEWPLL